jgi:ABC-2 type transport system permease protein
MRSFSEEKKIHTLTLLRSRPVTIPVLLSVKITALTITLIITILPTFIYAIYLYFHGVPTGNIDMGATAASYIGLLILGITFISLSVFASSLTSNQVTALISGMALCVFFYYGLDLISMEKFGLLFHYKSVQRGLIESSDLAYFLIISLLFYYFTVINLSFDKVSACRSIFYFSYAGLLFFLCFLGLTYSFRFDWTKDKRYTIHSISKEFFKKIDSPLIFEVYLAGNLNPGFKRLQESTLNLIRDFNKISPQNVEYKIIDPYLQGKGFIARLTEEGVKGISVNERNDAGRFTRNVIFPYLSMKYKNIQIPVPLLINQTGRSGEENLNLSRELLEYQLIHAIRLATQKKVKKIVFLEGHNELSEKITGEITDYLSSEYTIDRGILSGSQGELDGYDLVIIAGPQLPFSEEDKFELDQYLMQGGSILWFVHGMQLHSYEELAQKGKTLCKANDLNLNDLFFNYGFRISPVILQDTQCLPIPVAVETTGHQTDYVSKPWYYSPLLLPDNISEITKGLSFVKTGFTGILSILKNTSDQSSEILLSSSQHAHAVPLPVIINLTEIDKSHFNESNLPVAVLLRSPFVSAFKNRYMFYAKDRRFLPESSKSAKMIVVASEGIITDPLGYDSYSQTEFANKEFVMNCVNYLTDDMGTSVLKNKSLQTQLLNKQKIQQHPNQLFFINVVIPPFILFSVYLVLWIVRKRKYQKRYNEFSNEYLLAKKIKIK